MGFIGARSPYYVPHLYYAIHFHAFVFLMLAIRVALSFGGRIAKRSGTLFPLTIVPYHYIALRRVFGGTRWQVAWKGTLIALAYTLTSSRYMLAPGLMTIRAMPARRREGLTPSVASSPVRPRPTPRRRCCPS